MDTWLLVAFVAPTLWAFVVLLDIYFTQKAYTEAVEGTVISGLYQGIVLLAIPFVGYAWPSSGWLFFFSGLCFIFSCHWYLRSLVIGGDGPIAQIIFNLSIVLVPLFAWVFSNEHLQVAQYFGIALAFLGGFVLAWDKNLLHQNLRRIGLNMLPAVVALALSMTLQKEGFNEAPQFLPGFLTFSIGVASGGLIALLMNPRRWEVGQRIVALCRQYWHSFLLGETLSVIAIFSSSFAISLAPSVSFVIVIESLVPVLVMIFSILLSRSFFALKSSEYRAMYEEQMNGILGKIGATAIIACGIYLIAR
jgi:drug/metabolite transporter (DMT)-like permease